jgi:diguanylate cyclase
MNRNQASGAMNKILVIEDDDCVRANVIEFLEMENFEAIAAENGYIGVQLAQEHSPDLILCDITMPQLDGYGVLTTLQQRIDTASIPLIFLTGKSTKTDFREGMALGADDYITKPFTHDELLSVITTQLKKRVAITQPYITALQRATVTLDSYLYYDNVTHLPTRLLLQEKFHQRQLINQGHLLPVLCLDLDRFRQLTNSLTDTEGEFLIRAVAQRLQNCIGQQDLLARWEGEQFVLILMNTEPLYIHKTCQQLLGTFSQPFQVGNQDFFITASLGVTFSSHGDSQLTDLVKQAKIAMNYVQRMGGNLYRFYAAYMNERSTSRLTLEASLRRALERDEFRVHYQPQVDLQTGRITGTEALLRWQHSEAGIVSPADFIPLAEETGLIQPIGNWVLHTACQQTKNWQDAGFYLNVAVNVSGQQLSCPQLRQTIAQVLQNVGLSPRYLELELTESTLLQNASVAGAMLNELRKLGIQIAIDDFGTGYTSLKYLKQLPVDTLKVDRCFVRQIPNDRRNSAIVAAVLQMAHHLSLKVVAEGVETEAELSFLQKLNCDLIQGYLFSRPLPPGDVEVLLASGKSLQVEIGESFWRSSP